MPSVTSQRIVVTGASQGIGAAIARAFAAPGTALALIARGRKGLEETATVCRALGAEAIVLPCDVTDEAAVNEVASAIVRDLGTPTVVVNNAGVFSPGGVLSMDAATFRAQIDANLTSAFLVTKAFLQPMVDAGAGHVVFIGSTASILGYPSGVAYGAAKHGLLGLARALREEMKPHGVRVTSVLPGATLTASWAGSGLPDERFMPAEDIAEAVVCACRLTGRSVIEEILVRPQLGDIG